MKPSELLKMGWCQGALRDGDKHCIVGASIACCSSETDRMFRGIVGRLIGNHFLTRWNDHPRRTQAEVVAVAERAEKEMGL
jgi:hypothetical protein